MAKLSTDSTFGVVLTSSFIASLSVMGVDCRCNELGLHSVMSAAISVMSCDMLSRNPVITARLNTITATLTATAMVAMCSITPCEESPCEDVRLAM